MSATPEFGCVAPPARRSGGRSPDVPTWICSTRPPARPGLLVRCRQLRSSAAPRLLRAASAVVVLTCRRGPARPHPAARPRPARLARPMSATPEFGCAAPPARRFGGRSPDLPTWICSTRPPARPARAAWVTRPAGHGPARAARLARDLPVRSRQLRSSAAPRLQRADSAAVLLSCLRRRRKLRDPLRRNDGRACPMPPAAAAPHRRARPSGRRRRGERPCTRQWVDGSVSISDRSPDQRVWNVPSSSTR